MSATARLLVGIGIEVGREPLEEARHAKQRHRASCDQEADLEVLAEQAAAQPVRLEIAVGEIAELGEQPVQIPACNKQEK